MDWDSLTMGEKNELIKTYVNNGIRSLDEMKNHYNTFKEGGYTKTDYPEEGLTPVKKRPDFPQKASRGKFHYDNAVGKGLVSSVAIDAYNEAIEQGLTEEQAFEYVYDAVATKNWHKGLSDSDIKKQEELAKKEEIEKQAFIGANYLFSDTADPNSQIYKQWVQWFKDNNIPIQPNTISSHTYDLLADKKKREEEFIENVKERPDYEGVKHLMIAAALSPVVIASAELGTGIFGKLPVWLKNALLENSAEYLAGYGIDKATQSITDNGEGLYRWFQEHPQLANTLELTTSGLEAASGVVERLPVPQKVANAAEMTNKIAHGFNAVYGGAAASDMSDGINRDNTIDAVRGLIPRAISDPNASSDEILLGTGALLNITPDIFQAVVPIQSKDENTK